jgi:uncharacterized protein (DUF305 family)
VRTVSTAVSAAAAVAAGVTMLALAGCTGDPTPPAAQSTAPVIAPGRPGEDARTLSPEEAVTAAPTPTPNAADVRFMQDMIVHHRQALDMSVLAPSRAESDALKRLAARIKDSQGPEIAFMSDWLKQEGLRVPDHHAGHAGMPGMASPEQMAALKAASGAEFDRLFVELMTAHHQGAITMVGKVLTEGSHVRVLELAKGIGAEQTAEIGRMRRLPTSD